MVMDTRKRTVTTEMEVTSIRLEATLKERLKEIAGGQGYQALIREILWHFIEQQSGENGHSAAMYPMGLADNGYFAAPAQHPLSSTDIRATFPAVAQGNERCALTGQAIQAQQSIWLGLTKSGGLVPLAVLPQES
jgi:predicted transcriptional regulator